MDIDESTYVFIHLTALFKWPTIISFGILRIDVFPFAIFHLTKWSGPSCQTKWAVTKYFVSNREALPFELICIFVYYTVRIQQWKCDKLMWKLPTQRVWVWQLKHIIANILVIVPSDTIMQQWSRFKSVPIVACCLIVIITRYKINPPCCVICMVVWIQLLFQDSIAINNITLGCVYAVFYVSQEWLISTLVIRVVIHWHTINVKVVSVG